MAEQHGTGGGLSKTFAKAAKHIFSFTMIAMMVAMALPAVAAAAPAGAATIGDLGMSLVNHYGTMFTAPVTEFSTLSDIFSNTVSGNLAPSAVSGFELGGHAAHAGHAMTDAAAGAGQAMYQGGSLAGADAAAHAAMGHDMAAACDFTSWQSTLSPENLTMMQGDAAAFGMGLEEYYQSNLCHG